MARSRRIQGPYELHPERPSHHLEGRAGRDAAARRSRADRRNARRSGLSHASVLAPAEGPAALAARARDGASRNASGARTTGFISRTAATFPPSRFRRPSRKRGAATAEGAARHAFSPGGLPLDFQWLRTPHPERIFSLSARPGWLRLFARESIGSWFEQALVARRQEHFAYRAETELDFQPQSFQQAAGLAAYYNRYKFHFLAVDLGRDAGPRADDLSCEGDYPEGNLSFPLAAPVRARRRGPVRLAVIGRTREAAVRLVLEAANGANVGPVARRVDPVR